ncbi:MAG TPA: hypothetical protein VHD62_14695 [Opitutaceae bacterium]|nr:hypothetical protein [Opitutaceae bacterium]
MSSLPTPNEDLALLRKATAIKEIWSPDDASSMLEEGFTLVGISPQGKDDPHPFIYSLIWTTPLDQTPQIVRQRHSF